MVGTILGGVCISFISFLRCNYFLAFFFFNYFFLIISCLKMRGRWEMGGSFWQIWNCTQLWIWRRRKGFICSRQWYIRQGWVRQGCSCLRKGCSEKVRTFRRKDSTCSRQGCTCNRQYCICSRWYFSRNWGGSRGSSRKMDRWWSHNRMGYHFFAFVFIQAKFRPEFLSL